MSDLEIAYRFFMKGQVNEISSRKAFCYVLVEIQKLLREALIVEDSRPIQNFRLGRLDGKIEKFIEELLTNDKESQSELERLRDEQEAPTRKTQEVSRR